MQVDYVSTKYSDQNVIRDTIKGQDKILQQTQKPRTRKGKSSNTFHLSREKDQ